MLNTLLLALGIWLGVADAPGGPAGIRILGTDSYRLHTDLPDDEARSLSAHLEVMNGAYRELFSGLRMPSASVMDVYVFQSQEAYLAALRDDWSVDGTGSGGMFVIRGSKRAVLTWKGGQGLDRVRSVLQHEGFHQFAAELFPDLPLWANEGLAELFEHAVVVDGRVVLGEVPAASIALLHRARDGNALLPFDSFFEIDSTEWVTHVRTGSAALQYTQAWGLVHFFLYAREGRWQKQFLSFLEQLNRGQEWSLAFRSSFGVDSWSEIQAEFLRYLDAMRPTDYRGTIRRLEFLAVGMQSLANEGVYPSSVQGLRQQLQNRSFEFTSRLFEAQRTMRADDASIYRVPESEDQTGGPMFILADDRGRTVNGGVAKRPWNIGTAGLEPRNFMVWWDRGRSGWSFRLDYE